MDQQFCETIGATGLKSITSNVNPNNLFDEYCDCDTRCNKCGKKKRIHIYKTPHTSPYSSTTVIHG